jgi:GT2 family glycosyltransferase
MLLSIIIVSYNTKALTLQTLQSVFESIENSSLLKNKTEIWVVDNDSNDGTPKAVEALKADHKHLHIISNPHNRGFASANNQAIKEASGEYLLLLNSDTIVHEDALNQLVETMMTQPDKEETAVLERTQGKLDRLGILTCRLLNPDGTVQSQGGSFPTLITIVSHMLLLDDLPKIGKLFPSTQYTGYNHQGEKHEPLYQLDWVGGTAMLVKREVFAEVGPLDSNIFMYGEDIEFCMRAKNHHWDVAILSTAEITHFGSASSSSKNAIIGELKTYLYIWAKHKPLWQTPIVRLILQVGVLLRIFLFGTMIRDTQRAQIYREAAHVLRST